MKKPDVVSLPSGLQYKVLRKGHGSYHPTVDSPCSCHYKGTLIDGTQFDSSYDRGSPTTFAPNQVIKGWTEAMQMMVEGDKWEMYIPSELAYGDSGSPPKIQGGDALIFTMEIIEIEGGKVPAQNCDPETLEECSDKLKTYISKSKIKYGGDIDFLQEEIDRLQRIGVDNPGVSPSNKDWALQRQRILKKLLTKAQHDEGEL
eukprot:CAMPEP_0184865130 /NCGR_PEP_ID=MMETSP0580-20130426/17066_1 /TAXON_ID=1118495 /ORGANISM="Dactyliosolen fragilissimus" /LENGTH=201 /DNA_ID=CAMNT_0027364201 /DNA_START=168 /DNA_END=773 /DNA_ORIENTATION=-